MVPGAAAMSVAEDGRQIRCDGQECRATARLPVALRHVLTGSGERRGVEGWLFVTREDDQRHFCPRCAHRHLTHLLTAM